MKNTLLKLNKIPDHPLKDDAIKYVDAISQIDGISILELDDISIDKPIGFNKIENITIKWYVGDDDNFATLRVTQTDVNVYYHPYHVDPDDDCSEDAHNGNDTCIIKSIRKSKTDSISELVKKLFAMMLELEKI